MLVIVLLGLMGLTLVFLEFFLPGFILAILGVICLLTSSTLVFVDYSALWGIFYLIGMCVLVGVICRLALGKLKGKEGKGAFYHGADQEGYVASSFDNQLIGKEGVVATELKPAGHIVVEGQLYQALSETGFISKGMVVKIVGGKGSHLIVRS